MLNSGGPDATRQTEDLSQSNVNPLSPVDAYLRQIIECAKGKDVYFNRPFGSCKWAMPMSISCKPSSPLYTS